MKKILCVLFACAVVIFGQDRWNTRAHVNNYIQFFSEVMQETVSELERRGFSSLKLINFTQNIDAQMYKWLVNGTVAYTNGFLTSIQMIDVTEFTQFVGTPTLDGVPTPRASVSGSLNFIGTKVGYDVIFTPRGGPEQRYTGAFSHDLVDFPIMIFKNLNNNTITATVRSNTSRGGMVYKPSNNVTEVLSRFFIADNNSAGIAIWRSILEQIIVDIVTNKVEFPEVCFGNC